MKSQWIGEGLFFPSFFHIFHSLHVLATCWWKQPLDFIFFSFLLSHLLRYLMICLQLVPVTTTFPLTSSPRFRPAKTIGTLSIFHWHTIIHWFIDLLIDSVLIHCQWIYSRTWVLYLNTMIPITIHLAWIAFTVITFQVLGIYSISLTPRVPAKGIFHGLIYLTTDMLCWTVYCLFLIFFPSSTVRMAFASFIVLSLIHTILSFTLQYTICAHWRTTWRKARFIWKASSTHSRLWRRW